MWIVNYRNMKLYLNKGSCVLTETKLHVSNTAQTQPKVLHSIFHSSFNVLNILRGIGYIKEWWSRIIRIIYTLLKLMNAYTLSKDWLNLPPTPSIHPTSLNHPKILCCCQELTPPHSTTAYSNIFQLPLWSLSKATIIFVTFFTVSIYKYL
jgi:hypothetical protein